MNFYLGIDPGDSGACAVLDQQRKVVDLRPFDRDDLEEMHVMLRGLASHDVQTAMEQVRSGACGFKGSDGTFKVNPTAAWTFGRNVGWWECALQAYRLPHLFVLPKKWQAEIVPGVNFAAMQPAERKRFLREEAKRRWPSHSKLITLATCDALLIADWCRRQYPLLGAAPEAT